MTPSLAILERMANSTFNIAQPKSTPKAAMIADTTEIAARNVVYKLLDATVGQPMRWATFHRMYESRAAIARAVERGWVILWGTSGKPLELKASLTDEGRRLGAQGEITFRLEVYCPHGKRNCTAPAAIVDPPTPPPY